MRQDNRCTDFFLEELDYDNMMNKWQQYHDSVHAQPVKFNMIQVSAEYYLRDAKARYIAASNEVFLRRTMKFSSVFRPKNVSRRQ